MALSKGTYLGPYEILGALGAGGMGEVYRAHDPRLGRDVAVKALPEAFARDPERVARFEREAKLLASLSHPNIGGIHGLEVVGEERYLVLEYVEGESLAQRLARGPLPIDDAIESCGLIAAGLEAAHENGIVHRDLKPGNIMLTSTGGVKVLDFGLAKSGTGTASDLSLSASPTMSYAATGAGVILGTAVYMSPEQARGKLVDRRTDVWSFGCVLYECLTGKQAFQGETVSDLIAQILGQEPDWGALPSQTPARVRELLKRCLRKDAKLRLRDIGDARLELAEAHAVPAVLEASRRATSVRGLRFPWIVAGVLALGLLVSLLLRSQPEPPASLSRFSIDTPRGGVLTGYPGTFDLSPDGRFIVFLLGDQKGSSRLWLRSLNDVTCHDLAGTEGAIHPFWSPDSRHIGFFAEGKLKRIAAAGGAAQTICQASNGRGGTWNASGVIVFAPDPLGPLLRVHANGGVPEPATVLDTTRAENSHRFPQFLPDGRHFLYGTTPEQGELNHTCVASLDEPHGRPVVMATLAARYVAPGYLVYPRGQGLLAQAFDVDKLEAIGEPVQLEDVPNVSAPIALAPGTSASQDGKTLLYGSAERRPTELVWVSRNGMRGDIVGNHPGLLVTPDLSPSADRLAVTDVVGTLGKGWIFDLNHGTSAALPSQGSLFEAKWTPDGRGLAWLEQVPGLNRIIYMSADGGDRKTLLETSKLYFEPMAWVPDASALLISQGIVGHLRDLLVLTPGQTETPTWVGTPAQEESPAFSHDGRWVAYASDISGRREVYIDVFPNPRGAKRVSSSGAGSLAGSAFVAWRLDDRELYYLGPDGTSMFACDVELGAGPSVGVPRLLFQIPTETWGIAAAPAGDRFLLLLPVGERPAALTLVQNWNRDLQMGD